MKMKSLFTIVLLVLVNMAYSQNVGIGTASPTELLHIKNGNSYIENGKLMLDKYGNQISKFGSNLRIQSQANLHLKPNGIYDVIIYGGGSEIARFDGQYGRLGIGTMNPQTEIDVDGVTRSTKFEIDNPSSNLQRTNFGYLKMSNSSHILLNAGQGGSANNSIFFQKNGISYAKFADGKLGIGTFLPKESIHTTGAIVIGDAIDETPGTIKYDGSNFIGRNGSKWKSLSSSDKMIDSDEDTEIRLNEGAQDNITTTINNLQVIKNETNGAGEVFNNYYSDPTSGAFQKVRNRFYYNGELSGTIGVSSNKILDLSGIDKIIMRGNNLSSSATYLSVGDFFGTDGVGITVGAYLTGGLRAMLDVRGSMECDGATINEVMTMTPMSQPASGSGGDVYMDDGSCNDCGGKIRLRYHNGISWNTL